MLSLLACLQSSVWMKRKTKKSFNERWRIVAYLDSFPLSWDLRQAQLASLPALCTSGRLQSQTQEELDALLPSVLRPSGGAFKGEL